MVRAKAIMTENVITVNENATITEAARLMVNKHVTSLLVLEDNTTIAVVTENDLIKGALNKIPDKVKVKDVMSKKFLIISPNTNYSYIVKKLRQEQIKRFPVVEANKLVGVIPETDILDATRDFTRFHQIMQEIILTIFGLVTAFFLFFFSPLGQSLSKFLLGG